MKAATDRALIAQGMAVARRRSIGTVVEARLGTAPDWLPARLEGVTRLSQLERLLRGVARVESLAELRALIPARRGRRRARRARRAS